MSETGFAAIDGHVHIHHCFDLQKFFNSAWQNLLKSQDKKGYNGAISGILILTESHDANWFADLYKQTEIPFEKTDSSNLKFVNTGEDCSLKVVIAEKKELTLIAGRQIVSKEKLEVLALGIPAHFGEREPAADIIRDIVSKGGIPVIPWGPGKWMGNRGKIVKDILSDSQPNSIFLGDNGNRLALWPRPSIFSLAEKQGIRILPGSDPLPFPAENGKAGRYGFVLKDCAVSEEPFNVLKKKLLTSQSSISTIGRLENPIRFIKNQFAMQLLKHKN
jgi:hypothetical protein